MALPVIPAIEPSKGSIVIDIPKETPDTIYWRESVKREEFASNKSPVSFPVGVGVDRNLLVAGVAGSGKSEFLKSMGPRS